MCTTLTAPPRFRSANVNAQSFKNRCGTEFTVNVAVPSVHATCTSQISKADVESGTVPSEGTVTGYRDVVANVDHANSPETPVVCYNLPDWGQANSIMQLMQRACL